MNRKLLILSCLLLSSCSNNNESSSIESSSSIDIISSSEVVASFDSTYDNKIDYSLDGINSYYKKENNLRILIICDNNSKAAYSDITSLTKDLSFSNVSIGIVYKEEISLSELTLNASSNDKIYDFYYVNNQTNYSDFSLSDALVFDNFDAIILGEYSDNVGENDTYKNAFGRLEKAFSNYTTNKDVKYYVNIPYYFDNPSSTYFNDKETMYLSTLKSIFDNALDNDLISGIIPTATLLMNIEDSTTNNTINQSNYDYVNYILLRSIIKDYDKYSNNESVLKAINDPLMKGEN